MGMEDNAKNFLVLIVQTVSSIILWLMMNILVGLYLKYGLFEKTPNITNIIYYVIFIIGSYFLFRYFKKRWQAIDLN
jgi:hypothetical protein